MDTTSPQMTFDGHMADTESQIASNGFKTTLWEPEFGWDATEEEASEPSYPAQVLAAFQVFLHFFVASSKRAWVHLGAEMQAGKTGVMSTLIRLVLSNARALRITPARIFVLTGMSDNAWKKQTRDRLPAALRSGVYHNKTLVKFTKELQRLAAGDYLSNVLILLDESHIASMEKNQPNKQIYQTLDRLCPRNLWQERNIRVLTISATDPAKVLAIADSKLPCAVVRLQTTSEYQSIQKLNEEGRIKHLNVFGDVTSEKGLQELKRILNTEFKDTPLYHLIRARHGKAAAFESYLKSQFPDAEVLRYDAETKAKSASSAASDGSSVSSELLNDINEILSEPPAKHTFIILKNMFYAAKTLDDSNVGILWDRIPNPGTKDDTNLQSLLGRACGYGKSKRTIVFASSHTVENYLSFWRELCANPKMSHELDVPAKKLDRKMPGIKASYVDESRAKLSNIATYASPYGIGLGHDKAAAAATNRQTANEDDFEQEWVEYNTITEARKAAPNSKNPIKVEGFYQCSTTGKKDKLRDEHIIKIQGGKKTANMDWKKLEIGKSSSRLYVGYRDLNDPESARFWVRTLKRVR